MATERGDPEPARTSGWGFAALPSVGVALLPKLTCPVCWPAYTALLGSFGISFVDYTPYLMPALVTFLGTTLWSLAHRARSRRGYGPFGLGAFGAVTVLGGKYVFEIDMGLYVGAGLLVAAALWNVWPTNRAGRTCPSTTRGGNYGCQTTD